MRRSSSLVLGATLLALAVAANAVAVSRPIAGKKLQLKRNTPNGTWTFVAKAAFLFPPIGGCGCLPDGAAACGTPGLPTCGGECPDDQVCRPIFVNGPPVTFGCGCGAPATCSDSGGGIECGNGMACGASPAFGGIGCIPIFCGDSCGQPCGDGGQCSRVRVGTSDFCACAVPEPCCDGGLVCPPFQTCVQGSSCGGCQSLF